MQNGRGDRDRVGTEALHMVRRMQETDRTSYLWHVSVAFEKYHRAFLDFVVDASQLWVNFIVTNLES